MSLGHMRPASQRQAELDEWLRKATGQGVVDLATLRGTMRAPTNLLQQLAETVLDSSVSLVPDGGLVALRRSWAAFDFDTRGYRPDHEAGMAVVADPLAAWAAAILGLVSTGGHVVVLEPAPPQIVDIIRRVGGMARTVSMRPTDWEFDLTAFVDRVGPQTDLIIVADPNPFSGQYLPQDAREAILDAVEKFSCLVLLDESARHSVVEGEAAAAGDFSGALGARCIRVDMPAAAVLAQAASAACLMGALELIAPIRSAVSAFGLGANVIAQSVLAQRFADGAAIDDAATLNGLITSGRALLIDGLDDMGILGLGGPGGWYVPVRAKALYDGPHDICEALVSEAGLGALPLAPFYVEGSVDPYVLFSYLRDASLLEHSLDRLAEFAEGPSGSVRLLALPSPEEWSDDDSPDIADDDELEEDEFESEDLAPVSDKIDLAGSAVSQAIRDQNGNQPREKDTNPKEGRVSDFADGDAKYRAAIAELNDARVDGLVGWQVGRSTGSTAERVDDNVPTVFKLSVPDIASPDISAPPTSAGVQSDPAKPDAAEPVKPAPRDQKSNEADRVKKADRPFFFDDPMV